MASSPMARALRASLFCAAPAVLTAGCRDLPPIGPDASTATGTTTSSSGSTDANATTTPDVTPTGPETLIISEVRTHGAGGDGFGDDFVELYNAGDAPVTVDGAWKLHQQSAQGAACQGLLTNFVGLGQVVPAHGHLLLGGWEYGKFDSATPAADSPLLMSTVDFSLADAGSIWLVHGATVIDAVCFYYDDATRASLGKTCPQPYECRGTPIQNLPHDGSSQASSSVNVSYERKPGAAGGLQNTGDNAADFGMTTPATPQNLASPLAP